MKGRIHLWHAGSYSPLHRQYETEPRLIQSLHGFGIHVEMHGLCKKNLLYIMSTGPEGKLWKQWWFLSVDLVQTQLWVCLWRHFQCGDTLPRAGVQDWVIGRKQAERQHPCSLLPAPCLGSDASVFSNFPTKEDWPQTRAKISFSLSSCF